MKLLFAILTLSGSAAFAENLPCVISSACIEDRAAYVLSIGSDVKDTYNVDAGQATCMITPNTTIKRLAMQRLRAVGDQLHRNGFCSDVISTIH